MNEEHLLNDSFERLLIDSEDDTNGGEDNDETENFIFVLDSDSDSESDNIKENEVDVDEPEDNWSSTIKTHNEWAFKEHAGVNYEMILNIKDPLEFFQLFFTEELLNVVVTETNKYGTQRDCNWIETTNDEIIKFIGLCFAMGLVRLPKLRDYWSTRPIFNKSIGSQIMSRNRFL